MRTAGIWLLWWGLMFLVWMALVATTASAEVLVGVGVAVIAVTAAEVVRRSGLVRLRLWALLPRHPVRLSGTVAVECWRLGPALWRQIRAPEDNVGAFRGIPFDAGPEDEPVAAARRAAYTVLISVTPNTYVIGIDLEAGNMLVHELVAGPRETTRERVLGKL